MLLECKVDKNAGKRATLGAAIKSLWKKSKIDETSNRLEAVRNQLQFRIIVSMKASLDTMSVQGKDLQVFDEPKRKIIEAILDTKADLQAAISSQTTELLRRQNNSDKLAEQRHQQLMSGISSMQTNSVSMTDPQIRQKILDHLSFNTMLDRDETIKDRHKHTFDWILADDPCTPKPKSDFAEWLCTGDCIYWISGKAGSGKSTLMKFIRNDTRTMQYLSAWAERVPLMVASFYFWKAGTHLQKSQAGLFRSLLHNVLEQCPDLSYVLFPKQYSEKANWNDFPTFNELKRAFQALLRQDTVRIVFFVDGLDEYEDTGATMSELVEMFKACVSSSRIKAVIASRPLQPFEVVFRDNPRIRLHELTHDDIHVYINDKLAQNPQMVELRRTDPLNSKALVNEVVESASGVFLWVRLVVQSLLEGLQSCDFISDLQSRLRELPQELEDLFQHMLLNIDPRYRMQSAQYFQIVRQYKKYPPPNIVNDGVLLPLSLQMFTDADHHITTSWSTRPTGADMLKKRQETATRLRSRCVGLLELTRDPFVVATPYDQSQEYLERWHDVIHVDYLHRSVLDFLERPAIWEVIIMQASSTEFDACVVLMKVALHLLKSIDWDGQVDELKGWIVGLVGQVKPCSLQLSNQLLDDLDSIMAVHFNSFRKAKRKEWQAFSQGRFENTHWSTIWPWGQIQYPNQFSRQCRGYHCSFLSFAIERDMICYVQEKLGEDGGNKSDQQKAELLVCACDMLGVRYMPSCIEPSYLMIDFLLQIGADPNRDPLGSSSWQHVLSGSHRRVHRSVWGPLVKRFILHGANVHAYVGMNSASRSPHHDCNWQFSALFVIKRALSYGVGYELNGVDWLDLWRHLGRPCHAESSAGEENVQLMEERGAEADMWRLVSDMGKRAWERVYPVPPSGQRVFREEDYFGPVQEDAQPTNLATEQLATEQLAAEQLAAEQLAAEQLAAEQLVAEQLVAEQLAAEQPPKQPEGKRARFKRLLHRRKK